MILVPALSKRYAGLADLIRPPGPGGLSRMGVQVINLIGYEQGPESPLKPLAGICRFDLAYTPMRELTPDLLARAI